MSSTSISLTPSVATRVSARLGAGARGRLAVLTAGLTLALGWTGLLLTHSTTQPVVPRATALHTVMSDPGVRRSLNRTGWQRFSVTPMDSHSEEVGFYRGSRMVATVTVGRTARGLFLDFTDLTREKYAYGSNIANAPVVLAGLALVFILATAVWPLWRLRNLDALVVAGTTLSVVMLNHWSLTRMVLVGYPAMIYLALRCACQALAPPGCRLPATPLYDHLARRWSAEQRIRLLRLAVGALALITVMVGVTSLHVIDVGYAVMEGGTLLLHGVLPYGHIPDVMHGDTYPIASYLLYVPFAAVWPVHNVFDDVDATLFIAVAAALFTAWASGRVAGKRTMSASGLRTAVAVLAFPPLLVTVSTGTTDVVLAAMLAAALLLWHRPGWSGAALSAAAWFKASPVLLLPLLLAPLRGRAIRRALFAVLAVSAAMLVVLLALGGAGAIKQMLSAMAFQLTRTSPHALWSLIGSVPLQQLSEALTLALVAGAAVRLRRDPGLAADRGRVAALCAAVLLGVQIAASYWSYMYLVWTIPFLVLALFAQTSPAATQEVG